MTREQCAVAAWMVDFGQEVKHSPTVPHQSVIDIRSKLILEEAEETIFSLSDKPFTEQSMIELADGIADLMVILLGTAAAFGIEILPIFNEVMRSNWTKLWLESEIGEMPTNCDCKRVRELPEIRCWLVKRADGKVIKSPSFSPPRIKELLDQQMRRV